MIGKLFSKKSRQGNMEHSEQAALLAVATLMVELMALDGRLDAAEQSAIISALKRHGRLDESEAARLIDQAQQHREHCSDIQRHTRQIIKQWSTEQRAAILADFWRIAFADGHADPYEEQLIRRIAELLGISHRQFIEGKISAGS